MNKKILRKTGAFLTAAAMLASFAGCGKDGGDSAEATVSEEASVTMQDEIRDIPSTELVKEIRIGWSLGNTLDSTGGEGVGSETSWGNPVTTKEMITAVKDAGFNIVRIPVTWGIHMDSENKIDEAWLNRVQEVVDYAYSQDMFVILNAHHEDWHDPYYDNLEPAKEKLSALWTQIGTRFAGYDERLIFEGLNEPRKRNTAQEWNGGDAEGHDVVNQLNQCFVDTIRGLGGNNAKRHLMIPTYAASSTQGAMSDLVLPANDDKIIVSLHAYLPYNFALGGDINHRDFTPDEGSASEITDLMSRIKTTFTDKGIPVIIGEFGARSKANEAVRAEWATYYVSQAKAIGVPCIVWDNHAFTGDGENFGLMDRPTATWHFPKIIDGLMAGLE